MILQIRCKGTKKFPYIETFLQIFFIFMHFFSKTHVLLLLYNASPTTDGERPGITAVK